MDETAAYPCKLAGCGAGQQAVVENRDVPLPEPQLRRSTAGRSHHAAERQYLIKCGNDHEEWYREIEADPDLVSHYLLARSQ